jgi:hypothetical protein
MLTPTNSYLLIARKNGSSSSRRQRRFESADALCRAIYRWSFEGFNVWWLFGPAPQNPSDERPLLSHWRDEAATE